MTAVDSDYLMRLTEAPNVEDVWAMHTERMARYGFDKLLYGFTRFRTATSLGNPRDFVILSNYPRGYVEAFINGGLYENAPMVNWALEHEGACSWSVLGDMMAEGGLSEAESRVREYNISCGIKAGYTISFKSVSARSKGGIALCAASGMSQEDVDAVWAEHGEALVLMNNIVHMKVLTLPHVPPEQTLTKRQRETLEWVGDGKTMQDIATIMGLTQATVEKHLRLAREALNVDTTAQAVLKAAFQNQMFILEDFRFTKP